MRIIIVLDYRRVSFSKFFRTQSRGLFDLLVSFIVPKSMINKLMKNSENTRDRDNKNEIRQDVQRQYKHDTKTDQDPQVGCAKILLFAMHQRILVLIRSLLIPYWEPNRIRCHKGRLCRHLLFFLAWVFNVIFPKPKACLRFFENFKVHTSSQPFSLRVHE